ncbi:unnamed protein product [Linum trigynum]|uniref:Uncharacterized protein n=1 Tax=Linum trigynum TaxID=586398 RepID=A0AAV2CXQ7_9ROSI
MVRYFPPSKTTEIRRQITLFAQDEDETLRDACEHYIDYSSNALAMDLMRTSRLETVFSKKTGCSSAHCANLTCSTRCLNK